MRWVDLWGILLLVGVCGLGPLAFASPPDPLWIGGVFDGGDTDDVIAAATSTEGATDGTTPDAARTSLAVADRVVPAGVGALVGWARATCHGRAPPAS